MREIVVLSDGPAKAREVRKGGVGRERKNNQDGSHRHVIEDAFTGHRGKQKRKNTLIAGPSGGGSLNAIRADEIGDSCEEHHQKSNDDRERAPGGRNDGFAERFHAIAYGFDPGHRGAAAGKCLEDAPSAGKRCRPRNWGKRLNRHRMTARKKRLEQAHEDGSEQRSCEQISWGHEDQPGIAHAAEIDQGDEHQDSEADGQGVGLQARRHRDKRADTSGNPNRDRQHVINHERRCSQKARGDAEVLSRDGVGASAAGIGLDRLPVREINDGQEDDDARADGNHVSDSRRAKRDQQRESGFGTVSRGAEGV